MGKMTASVVILALLTGAMQSVAEGAFYTRPALFSTRPAEDSRKPQSINRFGPVGIGIELQMPAFLMRVRNVEPGSPAEAAGGLKKGQIIESINGEKLRGIDPRIQLGRMLSRAEATDGTIALMVKDEAGASASKVIVRIPVLGAYSGTWPLNCPKSDRIVRDLANHAISMGWSGKIGLDGPRMLFLLSTGEERDLDVVRDWVKLTVEKNRNYGGAPPQNVYQWFVGWGAPPLAEYYLRTGDTSVLPLLKGIAAAVKKTQYHDGWGGRGIAGWHMGIAGTPTLTFLLLAKQCGVEMDEGMFRSALRHYYRFAGRGVNPYMDSRPESTFTDNGKCGLLGFAMAAATALAPGGERSVYAGARDICALKSFYSTSTMLHGHTGGGIGEVWRSAAMGILNRKTPALYREFMDQRQWFYDLSRRYDGSFGVLGGQRYDDTRYGIAMGLTYTAPRRTLCMTGAPRSRYAVDCPLPARPWGTVGDDSFLSLGAAADKTGCIRSILDGKVATDTGVPVERRLNDPDVTDEVLLRYVRHPEHRFRELAARAIRSHDRFHLVADLLKDADPRVRYAGVDALGEGTPADKISGEMVDLMFSMINDPEESWFVVDRTLMMVRNLSVDTLAPHIDRLTHFLEVDEWWLRQSALAALMPLAVDPRYYAKVLPAFRRALPDCIRPQPIHPLREFSNRLVGVDAKIQDAVRETLAAIYSAYPGKNGNPPGGLHPVLSEPWYLNTIAGCLGKIPGGLDALYEVARKRYPDNPLAHRNSFLRCADLDTFAPKSKGLFAPIILNELVSEFIGKKRAQLLREAAWERPRRAGKHRFATGALGGGGCYEGLSDLYRQAGVDDYNWHAFGPERTQIRWDYCTFDPSEKKEWGSSRWRYRKVSLPAGMEQWYAPGFDPGRAGWKRGLAPFASMNGKLNARSSNCTAPFCGCSAPAKTLWDKEVLLMRATIPFPRLKQGHRYRLLIGGSSHVSGGDGIAIYLNGKLVCEQTVGVGRREGGQPRGFFIDRSLAREFAGGPVTIAARAFLMWHPRARDIRGYLTIFMEEMKIPPLGPAEMIKSATTTPMTSSDWQQKRGDRNMFRHDGTFVANASVLGRWTMIGKVHAIAEFTPGTRTEANKRAPYKTITFNARGTMDHILRIWSGDMMMDLARNEALRMAHRTIGGGEYLFIEAGGFSARHGDGWTSPWYVMKRDAR